MENGSDKENVYKAMRDALVHIRKDPDLRDEKLDDESDSGDKEELNVIGRRRKGKHTTSVNQLVSDKRRFDENEMLGDQIGKLLEDSFIEQNRPKTIADCINTERPCPWVGCKYNLYLDVHPVTGAIIFNFSGQEPWEMKISCVLDVAKQGGVALERVGELMNFTRERVRQLEASAMRKIESTRFAREFARDFIKNRGNGELRKKLESKKGDSCKDAADINNAANDGGGRHAIGDDFDSDLNLDFSLGD